MIDVQEVKVPELYQQQKNPRYFRNIQTLSDGLSQSYLHCKSVPVVCLTQNSIKQRENKTYQGHQTLHALTKSPEMRT